MSEAVDNITIVRKIAKDLWKHRTQVIFGKPGTLRKPREMTPFGFDYHGINVEVHPEFNSIVSDVVVLRLVGLAYQKSTQEIVTRDLGHAIVLPIGE